MDRTREKTQAGKLLRTIYQNVFKTNIRTNAMKTPSSQTKITPCFRASGARSSVSLTRRLLVLNALVGLLTLGAAAAHANLLFNGNLDETSISTQINPSPTGWTIDGSKTISG